MITQSGCRTKRLCDIAPKANTAVFINRVEWTLAGWEDYP